LYGILNSDMNVRLEALKRLPASNLIEIEFRMAENIKPQNRRARKPVRPIRVDGDIAYITLTKGYTAIIDADDINLITGSWQAKVDGFVVYAKQSKSINGVKRNIAMHRLLISAPSDMHVDHIDGNGLNNRRSNLRLATRSQNNHNQKLTNRNTSGYKGVRIRKDTGRWSAEIKLNGKKISLGCFGNCEAAREAYAAASLKFHGSFGRIE